MTRLRYIQTLGYYFAHTKRKELSSHIKDKAEAHMHVTKWKKSVWETYILHDSFWERQISLFGGSKKIGCCPQLAHLRTLFFRKYLLGFHLALIFQGPSWEMLFLTSNSQPGVILSPKGLLAIPEDLFGGHVLAGGVPWHTKWEETRMLPTFYIRATKSAHHNSWACVLQRMKLMSLQPLLRKKRNHCKEKPVNHNEEWPALAATLESPCTALKTQCSKNKWMHK